ncbi:MAG: hypothetical protein RMK33_00105 [Arcobacter sp.]|nr:hypothetical protein [Bryobacteraceae bacterium]MDW8434549.1 hypothetical protein [Arcobacter sp.]
MTRLTSSAAPAICVNCGVPVDSQHFDESGFADAPAPGHRVVLARFALPPQYCGVLEYFAQFTDSFSTSAARAETPDLEWVLAVNGRPLYPYVGFSVILNPWGFGSFPVHIRLEDGAVLEFAVRGLAVPGPPTVSRVGGRILGRYWYNPVYGDPVRQRF